MRVRLVRPSVLHGWLLADEHSSDIRSDLLPVLVQHPQETIFRGGLAVVVPLLSVSDDLVFAVRLKREERVHSLRRTAVCQQNIHCGTDEDVPL